jgi:hypothetical protein
MSNAWIVLHHANACQVSSVALFSFASSATFCTLKTLQHTNKAVFNGLGFFRVRIAANLALNFQSQPGMLHGAGHAGVVHDLTTNRGSSMARPSRPNS